MKVSTTVPDGREWRNGSLLEEGSRGLVEGHRETGM